MFVKAVVSEFVGIKLHTGHFHNSATDNLWSCDISAPPLLTRNVNTDSAAYKPPLADVVLMIHHQLHRRWLLDVCGSHRNFYLKTTEEDLHLLR